MIQIFPCQSLWLASLWFTVIRAACGRRSREFDVLMSHLCSSQAETTANFCLSQRRLNLTFFPDAAAYLHKAVGVTPHFPRGYPKKESRSYITWISASGSFAFSLSCERKSSFSWFVSVWGVHITGSDNFRSCAFVSMVTGREGEGFLGVGVCVCVWWGSSWQTVSTHTDTCTNSQKVNNHCPHHHHPV